MDFLGLEQHLEALRGRPRAQELLLDTSELTRRSGAAARRAQALQTRQAELVARQQGLVSALGAASEAASLQERALGEWGVDLWSVYDVHAHVRR